MSDRLLILGLGSIGQRHARNVLALGCEVVGYDPAFPVGGERAAALVACGLTITDSPERGLAHSPLGVIVATPPETHYQIGLQLLEARMPVLMEKPLATTARDGDDLCKRYRWQTGFFLAVGYQLRYTAALCHLKTQADAGEFGTIYAAHAEFASQRWCSQTYKADLLLEASHELDLCRWFLGDPIRAIDCPPSTPHVGRYYHAAIRFPQATAILHLDGQSPGYRRRLTLYGTQGVGEWTFDPAENDQAYVEELRAFLALCIGIRHEYGVSSMPCTGRDGWWALRMVEAIRKSGESGRWEAV